MATRRELETRLERIITEMRQLYGAAGQRIQRELTKATLTDFQRFRLEEHQRQVQAIVRALNAEAVGLAQRGAETGYELGTNIMATALRRQGVSVSRISLGNAVHTGAVEAIAEQMAEDLVTANESMARTGRRILRATQQRVIDERQINELIAKGVVEGETRRQTSARLSQRLQTQLEEGRLIEINGRQYKPDSYAELVTRTRSREASSQGNINVGTEYGVDLYQVSVHEGSCPICQPVQGKVFSLSGESPDFPRLTDEARPPIHPRCEHVLLPYIPVPGEDEYQRLSELSRDDEAVVHDNEDYQRVLAGGAPNHEAKDFDEAAKARKRAAKAARVAPRNPAEHFLKEVQEIKDEQERNRIGYESRTEALIDKLESARATLLDDPENSEAKRTFERTATAIDREFEKWEKKHTELIERRAALLQVESPANVQTKIVSKVTSARRQTWERGVDAFSALVSDDLFPESKRTVTLHAGGRGRSHYAWNGNVKLGTGIREDVVVHELGHWLEDVNSDVHAAAVAFYQQRTAGATLETMRRLSNNPRYRPEEVGRNGGFIDPYVGKEYSGLRATEVVSMGLQYMQSDPERFARTDPEHFNFIYTLMRGPGA